ncbi:DUF5615 family PIN-like protein [Cupriavidus sp. CuC1]|uniref:DUF5615 family PIN-like protein n=1 Tax=Cupriavidus sp. CuC1 TaxID=3373131 RepID=UPI0037CE844D
MTARYRFLIDECLWPNLVQQAVRRGHWDTTCVRDRHLRGMKDHELIRYAVDHDYTLVTHNAADFRGPLGGPPGGHHARQPLHAGLVCLNSVKAMTPLRQQKLFAVAMDKAEKLPDLVNKALEVFEDEVGNVTTNVYDIPRLL